MRWSGVGGCTRLRSWRRLARYTAVAAWSRASAGGVVGSLAATATVTVTTPGWLPVCSMARAWIAARSRSPVARAVRVSAPGSRATNSSPPLRNLVLAAQSAGEGVGDRFQAGVAGGVAVEVVVVAELVEVEEQHGYRVLGVGEQGLGVGQGSGVVLTCRARV